MNRMLRGAAVATALLTLAGTAQAQGVSPISFGVAGGVSVPSGDYSDLAKMGYHGEVLMGIHMPAMPLSFRIDGFYHKFDGKDQPFVTDASARIIGGTANLVWDIPAAGPVRFYMIGGGGVYNIKEEATVEFPGNLQLGVSSGEQEAKDTKFGLNGGLGVRFALPGIQPFVEARYHSVFAEGTNMNVIPVTVGIMFR